MSASDSARLRLASPSPYTLEGLYAKHHQRGYVVYLAVVILLLCMVVALPFVYVDVGSQGRAIIQTTNPPTPVVIGAGGKVVQSNLRDNQVVAAGDTLLILDGTHLDAETRLLTTEITRCQEAIRDLHLLIASLHQDGFPELRSSVYQQDYQDYRQQLDEALLREAYTARQLQRQETLFSTRTIAEIEIERFRFEHEMAQNTTKQLQDRQHHLWTQQLSRKERELREYRVDASSLQRKTATYFAIAPTSGNLFNTTAILPGSVLEPGVMITEISPDSDLELAVSVSPADIGMIRPGMLVNVEIDAYSSSRWGFAQAEIREIARDISATANGQLSFLVKCTLRETSLALPSGHQGNLKKGMTATAHFVLARRSLFQLLQDRVEDWLPNPINTQQ